jgi:hypothetical protein
MKRIIVILLAMLPFSAFCQNPAKLTSDKFAVGFVFSPNHCFRTLSSDASSEWISDSREDMEIPKLGFTTGASLIFKPTPRIALETGLLLSDKGEKTKKLTYNTIDPESPLPIAATHNYHYVYLDIPAKVNYYILTGKAKLFVSAGASTNIFLKHTRTSTLEYNNGKEKKEFVSDNSGFNKVNFAAVAGLGMEYDITDKLRLRAEPIYRHSLGSIIDTPIKSYLYSAGVNFGIYSKL